MKKELKDYLHLYLGCEVICVKSFKGLPEYWAEGDIAILTPTLLIDAEKFKPLLRPLSDMTEEEIKEVAWILHRFKPEEVRGKDSVGNIKVTNKSPFYYWINVRQHLNAECCIYLLSKGFDLFELIESGLAIDKTLTHTQNIKL